MAAAGRGERLGAGPPKALRQLAGEPLLVHAVRALAAAASVRTVVVAAPPADVGAVRALLRTTLDEVAPVELCVVAGAASRQGSVAAALSALPPDVDVVLVHDAARPLAPVALVDAVEAAVRGGIDAVVPGLPLSDTVKEVDEQGLVVSTPQRARLRVVQTPQGFRREILEAAYAAAAREAAPAATDDAALVERCGTVVRVVPGAAEAFKVTDPLDLALAEALIATRDTR